MAQNNYNWPINPTTVNSGPIQYEINGAPTTVNIDTGTPANSTPLPVRLYDSSGNILNFNNDYGASSGALRTAAQIGNATGAADFGAGATGAQTIRVEANQGAANATPWNVAAASLPLPTGAATETTLAALEAKVLTDAQLRATPVPVSLASVPLATGAATEAKQDAEITQLTTLNAKDFATQTTLSGVKTDTATIAAKDFATQTTLAAAAADLALIEAKDFATETTLAAMSAKLPATLGQKTSANSLAVVLSSDQSAIPVTASSAVNTGSFAQITNLVATAQTFTAPANAVGFKIQAPSTNTENVAFSIGATATITAGILMEPGRSEDFDTGSNISVIATSATQQTVNVLWKVKP